MTLALDIQQLKKTYKSGTVALTGIDLQVQQGDFFALLGPNGAGKSTCIGIISSLVNKSSGTVKVFDFDIDTTLEDAKSQLGLVPQEFNFNQFETVLQIVVNQAGYYGVPKSVWPWCGPKNTSVSWACGTNAMPARGNYPAA